MNKIILQGKINNNTIEIKRASGTIDIINFVYDKDKDMESGTLVQLSGSLKSTNTDKLNVFAKITSHKLITEVDQNQCNFATFTGVICKSPIIRKTPLGKSIAEFMIAINEVGNNSSYIPVIAWGNITKRIASYKVGDKFLITGRLQSRIYTKLKVEVHTTYELSVINMEHIF